MPCFHDVPEIITGDLPTPVKYYSDQVKGAYDEMESAAIERLEGLLPDDLRPDFDGIFHDGDEHLRKIVKAADKISALIKCKDELALGNREFRSRKVDRGCGKGIATPCCGYLFE